MEWFGGQTAVVTGAAHGIGRASAELLCERGARVIAVDIDDAALRSAFSATPITPHQADVAADGSRLGATLLDLYGPVDLLVNNVGVDTDDDFLSLQETDFDNVFAANLRGPWFLTRALAARMVHDQRGGSIVFVSSLHDRLIRTRPHYSASKAAVAMLVKELASLLGPHRIRVNAVSPGIVHSAHVPPPVNDCERRRLQALIPLGRIGEPREVAQMISLLLNDESSGYVTGANVNVDGGLGVHSFSREAT
jgi:NAD(P)-dependent dehydrogenase (short-subunit alcohol dehydrogenase family)